MLMAKKLRAWSPFGKLRFLAALADKVARLASPRTDGAEKAIKLVGLTGDSGRE